MDWQRELVERVALHWREDHGPMSDGAFEELRDAVAADVEAFTTRPEDRAFAVVARAVAAHDRAREGEEFLGDDEYLRSRSERLGRLAAACDDALAVDPDCPDARLLQILAAESDASDQVAALRALDGRISGEGPLAVPGLADAWDDVSCRPRLRVRAALAVMALEAACIRTALDAALSLVDAMARDELGMGRTAALALARLEDEEGFDALDARFGRRGNAWSNLARTLMLFKLDRMAAARRALTGFRSLNEGASYALLRPTYVDTYLPCRPDAAPGSFEEAVLAVHEADPVVVDAPDFVTWCSEQPGVLDEAAAFARANGLDW